MRQLSGDVGFRFLRANVAGQKRPSCSTCRIAEKRTQPRAGRNRRFDVILKAAWAQHGDRPSDVADRLAASVGSIQKGKAFP